MRRLDLHLRILNEDILKRLLLYGYEVVLVDQLMKVDISVDRPLIVRRMGIASHLKDIKRIPPPIIHINPTREEARILIDIIRRYPNRVKAVEVDLVDISKCFRTDLLATLCKLSVYLLSRGIPIFVSSGARSEEDIVPPEILIWLTSSFSFKWNPLRSKPYKQFYTFLDKVIFNHEKGS